MAHIAPLPYGGGAMTLAIPNEMPASFAAGTTLKYRRAYADFPASQGWTLTLYLTEGKALAVNSKAAVADGDAFLFTIPATGVGLTTDDIAPGVYTWVELASKAGEVYPCPGGRGVVTVDPNPTTDTAGANQQWIEKVLELVEARIAGRTVDGADVESYQIAGRALTKIPFRELMGIRNILRSQLRALRAGGKFTREVLIKFTGAGMA